MIAARINVYLPPTGLREMDGWIPCAVAAVRLPAAARAAMRPRIGVVQLTCKSGKMAWFGFSQPMGSKVTDGWPTRGEAATAGIEVLDALARLRG